jgi:hypothetical protein
VVVEKTVIVSVRTDDNPTVHHDLQGHVQRVHGKGWEDIHLLQIYSFVVSIALVLAK